MIVHINTIVQGVMYGIFLSLNFVKIDSNAAINKEKACIVAVGRNYKGEVVFVLTEITHEQDPLKA